MALEVAVGTLTVNASTGNQDVTGLSFQPKLVIFFTGDSNAFGAAAHVMLGFGAATSSSQRFGGGAYSEDGNGTSVARLDWGTDVCIGVYQAVGTQWWADFVQFNSDGFRINVTTAPASTRKVIYLAIGGSDLTNVKVGSIDLTTGTGDFSTTSPGFQPDCVILSSMLTSTTEAAASFFSWAIGCMTASAQRAVSIYGQDGQGTSNENRCGSDAHCLLREGGSGGVGSVDVKCTFVSMDANGFTINKGTAPASNYRVGYIALKGGQYSIGTMSQPTSAQSKSETGHAFTPVALLNFGASQLTADDDGTTKTEASHCVGAATGSAAEGVIAGRSLDAQNTSDTYRRNEETACMCSVTPSSTQSIADFTSFNSDGYTVNWSTADGSARLFYSLLFGSAAVTSDVAPKVQQLASCEV